MQEESRGVCPSLCLLPWEPGCYPSYRSGKVVLRDRLINGRVLQARPRGVIMRQGRKLDAEAGDLVLIHAVGVLPLRPQYSMGEVLFQRRARLSKLSWEERVELDNQGAKRLPIRSRSWRVKGQGTARPCQALVWARPATLLLQARGGLGRDLTGRECACVCVCPWACAHVDV